jgi:hypothetical protein
MKYFVSTLFSTQECHFFSKDLSEMMLLSFLLQPRLGGTLRAARENIEIAPMSDLFSKISMGFQEKLGNCEKENSK